MNRPPIHRFALFVAIGLLAFSSAASRVEAQDLTDFEGLDTGNVGRSDIPSIESLAEALVTDADGGAIAVWAPTGVSLSGAAHTLNLLYASSLVAAADDAALGDIVLETLRAFGAAGGSIEMLNAYALAGDPAVQLP